MSLALLALGVLTTAAVLFKVNFTQTGCQHGPAPNRLRAAATSPNWSCSSGANTWGWSTTCS